MSDSSQDHFTVAGRKIRRGTQKLMSDPTTPEKAARAVATAKLAPLRRVTIGKAETPTMRERLARALAEHDPRSYQPDLNVIEPEPHHYDQADVVQSILNETKD